MQKLSLIFNKYFFIWIAFLIVFIPLYPKFPLLNISGTYVAIRLEDIFIALTVFLWLIGNLNNLKKYLGRTIFQAIILFWGIGLLSLFSALFITYFVQPHLGIFHLIRRIEYMSLFIIAATSIRTIKQGKIILTIALITTLFVVVYGYGQIWLNFPVISTTNKEFSKGLVLYLTDGARVNSTFAGHYDLAVYLSFMLVFIGGLFFYYKNLILKGVLIILGTVSFILLGFTASRVSFIAVLIGLALSFWLLKKRLILACLIVSAIAVVALIPDLRHRLVATVTVNILQGGGPKYTPPPGKVTVFTDLRSYPKDVQKAMREKAILESTMSASPSGIIVADIAPSEPINPTELGVYRSWGIRFNVEWPRALNAFYKNPFLGTGYSSLTIATDNDFLRSLGEVGILGTFSLGIIFLLLFKKTFQGIKENNGFIKYISVTSFCAIVTFLVSALFIDVLEASKVAEFFWLFTGVAWGIIEKKDIID